MTMRMKVILVGVLLMAVSNRAVAADKTIALFNGRDLSGWTYHFDKPDVRMEDVWSVKDGILLCEGQPTGYLVTRRTISKIMFSRSSGDGRERAVTTAY